MGIFFEVFLPTSRSPLTEREDPRAALAAWALGELERSHRGYRRVATVTDHLQPAPLEPAGMIAQPALGLIRRHHVDGARVEEHGTLDVVQARTVSVSVDDHVGSWEAAAEAAQNSPARPEQAQREGAQQRDGLLDQPAPVAVHDGDPAAADGDLAPGWQLRH